MESNVLKVFISSGCYGCHRAQELAGWVQELQPRLEVRIVDLAEDPDADMGVVFAVPTYVYNGKPLFLGNPSPQELQRWLDSLDPSTSLRADLEA
jgi:hypothetical protein